MARRRVLCLLLSSLSLGRAAVAQSPTTERVRIELSVPPSCSEAIVSFAHVRERLGTAWEAQPGELARTILVSVVPRSDRYVARIDLTDARGHRVVRAVGGTECEQVIDGIALITVLAIQAQLEQPNTQSDGGGERLATPSTAPPEPGSSPALAARTAAPPRPRAATSRQSSRASALALGSRCFRERNRR